MDLWVSSKDGSFVHLRHRDEFEWIDFLCGMINLHIPDGGEMSVFLCVSDGDAYESRLCQFPFYSFLLISIAYVNHRRTLLVVVGAVGEESPICTVLGDIYAVLIEEGGVFKLCEYLVESLDLAQIEDKAGWCMCIGSAP